KGMGAAVAMWDVATGNEVFSLKGTLRSALDGGLSKDGTLGVAGGATGIQVWDMKTGKEVCKIGGPAGVGFPTGFTGVAISPNGGRVLSIGRDDMVRLWDVKNGNELSKLEAAGPGGPG